MILLSLLGKQFFYVRIIKGQLKFGIGIGIGIGIANIFIHIQDERGVGSRFLILFSASAVRSFMTIFHCIPLHTI